ncbi:hypothetical protein Cfor_12283 [Coptotermes formosanus]|uniref:Gustatory receptor n=1 Tax=Coptotermes formosanus TaxID=36987 RepID=A0A6L2PHV4_COPFO|nr:hypothetical protein Cfor_12283 [Coptotermes formosanus]
MHGLFRGRNFLSSTRPLYYASRVLGLAPFSFTGKFAVKGKGTAWMLYTVVILIVVFSCSIMCTVQRVQQSGLLVPVVVNEFLMIFLGTLAAFSSILISITRNGVKSRNIVSKIIKIDEAVLNDSNTTYIKMFIFTLIQVTVVYSYAAVLFTYDTLIWTEAVPKVSIWYFISGYPHRFVNLEVVVEFCDLVLVLRSRLKSLNSRLDFILRKSNEPYANAFAFTSALCNSVSTSCVKENEIRVSEIKGDKIVPFIESPGSINRLRPPRFETSRQRNIRIARELYDDLCDVSLLINSMYGFQILLALGATTVELTLSSYLVLETIRGNHAVEVDSVGKFISLMTAWLFLYAFKLISITAPCQSTTSEVENTVMLVQKLLLARFDPNTTAELQLFSQQLFHRKMKFTAFGFIKLNYSLLLTIIGGVITYVVIAMQYNK